MLCRSLVFALLIFVISYLELIAPVIMAHLFGILVDLILIGYIGHCVNAGDAFGQFRIIVSFILKYLYGSCDSDIQLLSRFYTWCIT